MVNTLLFDLDGTLLDTNQLIIDNFYEVFKAHLPQITLDDQTVRSFIGPTLRASFSKYVNTEEEIDFLVAEYRKINDQTHDDKVTIYDHVYDVIKNLSLKGYHLAIVSSKKKDLVLRGLKLFHLESFFSVIIGSEDVKNHKPHPEAIFKALEHFKDADQVLFIGDSSGDINAAKNADIKSIGVSWSYNLADLKNSQPDYMIQSFLEILQIIEEENHLC